MTVPAVISIDPPGARDLDDAIHARRDPTGRWRVDVVLPDPTVVVPVGSSADAAARNAGTTTYGAAGIRRSMLPPEAAEGLTLSPHRNGSAVHVVLDVSPDLQARVASATRTSLRTAAALTYAQADRILEDVSDPLHPDLSRLWDLASRLHEERAAATGAVFDLATRTMTDEEGRIVRIDDRRAHRSNMIVMEFMVLANAALARHARDLGLPVLFRNHLLEGASFGARADAAAEIAVREGIGRHAAMARLRTMAHLVRQADLGTTSLGHHGLDLEAYGWFTSPLRRYADLANLRALLDGYADPEIETLAARLTGIHRDQGRSNAEHHAARSRQRLLPMLHRGAYDELDRSPLHVLLRALRENPGYGLDKARDYTMHRMRRGGLSGEDIAALRASGPEFGSDAVDGIERWISEDPERSASLAAYEAGAMHNVPPAPSAEANHKGALLELATRLRAAVSFSDPERTGPAHAPTFAVTCTWRGPKGTVARTGNSRSVRTASHVAAGLVIEALAGEGTTGRAASIPPPPPASPKNVLLERATAAGATVTFGSHRSAGPDHRRTFEVDVSWTHGGKTIKITGAGASKREAERKASERLVSLLDAPAS